MTKDPNWPLNRTLDIPNPLIPYLMLMEAHLDERLSPTEFSFLYVRMFLRDDTPWEELYPIMQDVFGAAECYAEDADPNNPHEVDEQELRDSVRTGVRKLREILSDGA